jgi:phospholipase/carboxylesterase
MRRLFALAATLAAACVGATPPVRPPVHAALTPIPEEEVPLDTWPVAAPAELFLELELAGLIARIESTPGELEYDPDEPLAPGDVTGVYVTEGTIRGFRYLEVVLGSAHPDDRLPLVVYLHGRADRPRIPGGPYLDLPTPVRVFIPRAPERVGGGYTWLPTYLRAGQMELFTTSLRDTAARVAVAIHDFAQERPTRGAPIVTGFSQGGHLAWTLGVRHPEVVGLALPMAGTMPISLVPDALDPSAPHPAFRAEHGTLDHPVPVELTRELAETLRARGLDVTLVEVEGAGHEMTPEMDARFHDWLAAALSQPGAFDAPWPEPEPWMETDEERTREVHEAEANEGLRAQ